MEPTPYEYTLKESSQFKKDLKAVKFDEHKLDELQKVLECLGRTGIVPAEYYPHPRLVRLGSYSKLYDKQRKRR